jgi:hypothetical protein
LLCDTIELASLRVKKDFESIEFLEKPFMAPGELRESLKHDPFEPFRLILTDGSGFDIRHPDLLMVGKRTAIVGLTGEPGQTFFERSVKVDLFDIIRVDPINTPSTGNGSP